MAQWPSGSAFAMYAKGRTFEPTWRRAFFFNFFFSKMSDRSGTKIVSEVREFSLKNGRMNKIVPREQANNSPQKHFR